MDIQVFAVEKENLNWWIPKAIRERFDKEVTAAHGAKGKWYGAVAAIAMYLEADPETRSQYSQRALQTQTDFGVQQMLQQIEEAQQQHAQEAEEDAPSPKAAAKKTGKKKGTRRGPPTT